MKRVNPLCFSKTLFSSLPPFQANLLALFLYLIDLWCFYPEGSAATAIMSDAGQWPLLIPAVKIQKGVEKVELVT